MVFQEARAALVGILSIPESREMLQATSYQTLSGTEPMPERPLTFLCITTYEKGQEFMRECKRQAAA